MATTESRKSDLEKRLHLLRQQVYGKSDSPMSQTKGEGYEKSVSSDLSYLQQDLFKILTFSSLAIGIQIMLFFLIKNHILKLNFF